MSKPLAIDLFCGLGGWAEGFLAEGWDVVGFDNHQHVYGEALYPAQLVIQDVLTLHGSQFRHADCIVASPPCQKYSWMAMPWSLAKREVRWQEWERDSPFGDRLADLNALFNACFRIQWEASEAAGRHIPMVVENVKGAQKWVGRAAWHHGSFFLWGDVPALMPHTLKIRKSKHTPLCEVPAGTGSTSWFFGNSKHEGRNYGMEDALKVPGINWNDRSKPAQGFNVEAAKRWREEHGNTTGQKHGEEYAMTRGPVEGIKQGGSGAAWFDDVLNERRKEATAIKNGGDWFGSGENGSQQRKHSSRSDSRKAASAMIAKIPPALSEYIARYYRA
jgi:C-5 cytosine-specific DNA methylase